jgi:hypothetical protein
VLIVDLQCPRQRGRTAVQLLVEVVAPATDRLGQRQTWGDRVEAGTERDAPALGRPRADEDAGEHPAGDAQAALPDREDPPPVALEQLPVGGDVVDPRADDAGDDAPDADGVGVLAGADVALLEAAAEQPHGGDDAEGDHQAVGVERQRPDLQAARRRARDAGQHGPHVRNR